MKTILTTLILLLSILVFAPNAAADCLGVDTENTELPCWSSPYDTDGDGIPDWTVISYNDGTACAGAGFNDLPYGMQPFAPFVGAVAGPCGGPSAAVVAGCHPFLAGPCDPIVSAGAGGGGVPVVAGGASVSPTYGVYAVLRAPDGTNWMTADYNAFQDQTRVCAQLVSASVFTECVTIQMPA